MTILALRVAAAADLHAEPAGRVRGMPGAGQCLEFSMRVWDTGGEHGIWGGLVEADRVAVRGWQPERR